MYKILARQMLAPNMHLLKVYSPDIARKAKPGNFALLIPDEKGERVPLTISDRDIEEGSVTSIFMEVGATTCKLAQLNAGDSIMAHVGPLGLPTEIKKLRNRSLRWWLLWYWRYLSHYKGIKRGGEPGYFCYRGQE